MHFLHDLRARLQERKNRLYKTSSQEFENELGQFLGFIEGNTYTGALIQRLLADESSGFAQWESEVANARSSRLPQSEIGRAKVCYELLRHCADDPSQNEAFQWAHRFGRSDRTDDALTDLIETVAEPLVRYLHDRIDDMGNVLYVLQRIKIKAEWFSQKEMYQEYLSGTSKGEDSLDQALRASLFDAGIDYPFSQPASPSGKADIVAALGSSDPLVLEVKVYDPKRGRDVSHLRQGFHQVLRYANDYNEDVGYLVVFNCSDNALSFHVGDDSATEFPSRLTEAGKTIFLVGIDIGTDRLSASKESPTGRKVISREDLVGVGA